jgi:integrase
MSQARKFNPEWESATRPKGGKGEAAFWLPLLALFTGARRGELTGLRAADVAHDEIIGAVSIFITADRKAGKTLKTRHSARVVPVHPQLIKLGFLEFVEVAAKERGSNAWLFPEVAPGTTGAKAFSKWFGRYIGQHGITARGSVRRWPACRILDLICPIDETNGLHQFRHSFIDALRLAGVPGESTSPL